MEDLGMTALVGDDQWEMKWDEFAFGASLALAFYLSVLVVTVAVVQVISGGAL